MTLSDDRVLKTLNKNFVCGLRNIKGATNYAGSSNVHQPDYSAKCVNNSSGHHNVQMFFLTSDGKVLHCLPGFWSPDHFLIETEFAMGLGHYYFDSKGSVAKRNERYTDLHLQHALEHDRRLREASDLQGFDKGEVAKKEDGDFRREKGFVTEGIKTADQVLHERMAETPFVAFEKFDVAKFIDMGLKQYKYDDGVPGKDHHASPGPGKDTAKEKGKEGATSVKKKY